MQGEDAHGYLSSPSLLFLPMKSSQLIYLAHPVLLSRAFCSGSGFTFCRSKCLRLEVYSWCMVPCPETGGFDANDLVVVLVVTEGWEGPQWLSLPVAKLPRLPRQQHPHQAYAISTVSRDVHSGSYGKGDFLF